MFKEKILTDRLLIQPINEQNGIKNLNAVQTDGGGVRLSWDWPKDKSFNCAVVFEFAEGAVPDIESIYQLVIDGNAPRENITSKSDFNFYFDIKPARRVCRFAVFPYKIEKGMMILADQQNNATDTMVCRLDVRYRMRFERLAATKAEVIVDVFDRLSGKDSYNEFRRVTIDFTNYDELHRSENFVYYEVKSGDAEGKLFCIDLDLFDSDNSPYFFVDGSESVKLVSVGSQNINYIREADI